MDRHTPNRGASRRGHPMARVENRHGQLRVIHRLPDGSRRSESGFASLREARARAAELNQDVPATEPRN